MDLTAHCVYQAAAIMRSWFLQRDFKQKTGRPLSVVINLTGGGEQTRPESVNGID